MIDNVIDINNLLKELIRISKDGINYYKSKYEFLHNRVQVNHGSVITIAARPGHGKSILKQAITFDLIKQNPDRRWLVINYQLDMPVLTELKTDMVREKIIPNKDYPISEKEAIEFKNRFPQIVSYKIFDSVTSVEDIYIWSSSIIKTVEGKLGDDANKLSVIVSVDYATKVPSKERNYTIDLLMNKCTELRKKHNVIFLMLAQLNRTVMEEKRRKDGSYLNRIMDLDLYGSDAFIQHSDMVLALDVPAKRGIVNWSEQEIPVTNKTVIISHLKDREQNTYETIIYEQSNYDYVFVDNVSDEPKTILSKTYNQNNITETDTSISECIEDEIDDMNISNEELEF
jgi:hypothetical protein